MCWLFGKSSMSQLWSEPKLLAEEAVINTDDAGFEAHMQDTAACYSVSRSR